MAGGCVNPTPLGKGTTNYQPELLRDPYSPASDHLAGLSNLYWSTGHHWLLNCTHLPPIGTTPEKYIIMKETHL